MSTTPTPSAASISATFQVVGGTVNDGSAAILPCENVSSKADPLEFTRQVTDLGTLGNGRATRGLLAG